MDIQSVNEETRDAWEANATFWDEKMGEGNEFVNVLLWPALERFLKECFSAGKPRNNGESTNNHQGFLTGLALLDVATGNGLVARRLATLGAHVSAFDFSRELIKIARSKTPPEYQVKYSIIDVTRKEDLMTLEKNAFDCAVCNMALFDIAEIDTLFGTLPELLKSNGVFIFTITHPAFNNSSSVHVAEEYDDGSKINTVYSIRTSRYMTPYHAHGVAMRDQPQSQLYFERPLQEYFITGFKHGFILDGFEELAFPPKHPQSHPLSWGGNFSEIPPVLIARMRLHR